MGNIVSRTKLVLGAAIAINNFLSTFSKRIKASPGLPVENPSLAFWTIPKSSISSKGKTLPSHADVLIIGSGITGTSVAYHLLKRDEHLNVVMLEAREVCSGATGRNGGHINPPLFDDWEATKERYGLENAKKLVKFRLAHAQDINAVAISEGISVECQVRKTEHLEVYLEEEALQDTLAGFKAWKSDMPEEAEAWAAVIGVNASEKYHLAKDIAGVIVGPGGAIHPYRFVTSLLSNLLKRHEENFFIATQTPATAVLPPSSQCPYYTVVTPEGPITATHIVHATNGWVSHLVEPMREKVVPARGTMSVQRPGTALEPSTLSGYRSYIFHRGIIGYDYLTQLPSGENEFMFGGGWSSLYDVAVSDIGSPDDSGFNMTVASHLAGVLPYYFGIENWGKEKTPSREDEGDVKWGEGRTKSQWGGILGVSADGLPWVGRLSSTISGRPAPTLPLPSTVAKVQLHEPLLAAPGEWICAGYTGEGMVHAWMSGKALACMVQGAEDEIESWFPQMLRITEDRWRKAKFEDFIAGRL